MGICPVIISPGKTGLVKRSSGINKHACMLCGVTKVLKASLLFLIYRLLKLTLKIIFPYSIFDQMVYLFFGQAWLPVLNVFLSIFYHILDKRRILQTVTSKFQLQPQEQTPSDTTPITHEDKKVLKREKPALMRDANMNHIEQLRS